MKKKIKRILSLALVMMLLGNNNIFANELRADKKVANDNDTTIQPRSRYLASASKVKVFLRFMQISNLLKVLNQEQ